MAHPMISLITVALSNDSNLEATLKSLRHIREKYLDSYFEHIIVSPDTSCSKFESSRYVYKEPTGIYPAMNTGIEEAKGDYLWFLNSGDECIEAPDFSIIDEAERLNCPHIICFPVVRKYSNGQVKIYKGNLTNPHQGILYHRNVFPLVGNYDVRYKLISDRLIFDRLREFKVKMLKCENPIAYFEMNGVSSSEIGIIKSKKEFRIDFVRNPLRRMALLRFVMSFLR